MDDLRLTELVGQHPCLYDPRSNDYKDQNKKERAWRKIANVLKQSVDNCKKRWKNIRDTYNRRKRTGKWPIGPATKKTRCSRWYLQETLSFLDNMEYERENVSNMVSSDEDVNTTYEMIENDILEYEQKPDVTLLEVNLLTGDPLNLDEHSSELTENTSKRTESPTQLNYPKRQKTSDKNQLNAVESHKNFQEISENDPLEYDQKPDITTLEVNLLTKDPLNLNEHTSELTVNTSKRVVSPTQLNSPKRRKTAEKNVDVIECNNKKIEEDPIDAFFRSITMSVKKLPLSSQIKAKMEICRIVGELELMELQRQSSSMTVSSELPSQPSTANSTHSTSPSEACTNIND